MIGHLLLLHGTARHKRFLPTWLFHFPLVRLHSLWWFLIGITSSWSSNSFHWRFYLLIIFDWRTPIDSNYFRSLQLEELNAKCYLKPRSITSSVRRHNTLKNCRVEVKWSNYIIPMKWNAMKITQFWDLFGKLILVSVKLIAVKMESKKMRKNIIHLFIHINQVTDYNFLIQYILSKYNVKKIIRR